MKTNKNMDRRDFAKTIAVGAISGLVYNLITFKNRKKQIVKTKNPLTVTINPLAVNRNNKG